MAGSGQIEVRMKGVPLSDGCAVARICLFNEHRHSNLPQYRVSDTGVDHEVERVRRAVSIAVGHLDAVRVRVAEQIGPAEAEIFVAQKMILEDDALLRKILDPLREHQLNAETAIAQVLDAYEARLAKVDDEYIRERATDIGEVKRRLLDVLSNMRPAVQCSEAHCQKGRNRIIVAEELTPSMTVDLDARHTMGFVTERGGRLSHAAILARALGVPAVSGIKGIRERVSCGDELLINGSTGDVVMWPREATVRAMRDGVTAVRMPDPVPRVEGFSVLANISLASDVTEVMRMDADGIGLYRTEVEVIAAGRLLDEDELYGLYRGVVEAMAGRPVVFRVFDVGGDKPLPTVEPVREPNPALGWRGSRLLLGRPELLRAQARALARVARESPIDVMYPMIVDVEQYQAVRALFDELTVDLRGGAIRHGVMFEIPSACIEAEAVLTAADFGSIGTNDLIQYLFAIDRDNELVAADYRSDRPVLWRLLAEMVQAAERTGKPLSICGELAADPVHLARLLKLGFRSVSVNSRAIPSIRTAARVLLGRAK